MKRHVVFSLVFVTLAAVRMVAQQPQQDDGNQQAQERGARMSEYAKRLHLTDDQKRQVGEILKNEVQQGREIRQKYQGQQPPDRRAMMQDLKSLQDDVDGRMSKVLNVDQMQEWKKIRQENRERRRQQQQK